MGAVDIFAEFKFGGQTLLAEHMSKYGNQRKGDTSYISYRKCDQFFKLASHRVLNAIIGEARDAT
jgi:hypothetical protein